MKNIISHSYFRNNNKNHIVHEDWTRRHGISKEQINFDKSYILKGKNHIKNDFQKIPYLDFFDCDCLNINKKGHTLSNCEIYKRRQYRKLINNKLNMNERCSKIKYKQMMQCYKPDYNVFFYIKKLYIWKKTFKYCYPKNTQLFKSKCLNTVRIQLTR